MGRGMSGGKRIAFVYEVISSGRVTGVSVWIFLLLFGLWVFPFVSTGVGQESQAVGGASSREDLQVEAIAGEPFGVARIRYSVVPGTVDAENEPLRVRAIEGEIYYPAVQFETTLLRTGPPLVDIPPGRGVGRGRLLGRITNIIRTVTSEELAQVTAVETLFLFRGEAPLRIVYGQSGEEVVVRPVVPMVESDERYRGLLSRWWGAYTDRVGGLLAGGEYPPQIDAYLAGMLSRRLGLELPASLLAGKSGDTESEKGSGGIAPTLQLIMGSEAMRGELLRDISFGKPQYFQKRSLPVPGGPKWQSREALPFASGGPERQLGELAQYVPASSLYLRFGAFSHFQWFRDLTERFGGDLAQMVALRGVDYGVSRRTEELLNLRSTAIAKLLGPTVIEELAIVGSDLFLNDGPSIGVLFKPRNRFLLGTALRNERQATIRNSPDAELTEIEIDGFQVSYLSTDDGRIRSFLLETEEYFLVTSSEALVRDFLNVRRGERSLGEDAAFIASRQKMPLDSETVLYAYFSEEFFKRLAGPQYQIELRRRMQAVAEMQLLRSAELAARHEGSFLEGSAALESEGYLPRGFSDRSSERSGNAVQSGRLVDPVRGIQGAFVPIADMELGGVTAEEADWYASRASFFTDQWPEMDPLVVQVKRTLLQQQATDTQQRAIGGTGNPVVLKDAGVVGVPKHESIERLQIHAEVAPFGAQKYGWITDQLGPPTRRMMAMPGDDVAWVQAYLEGDFLGRILPPHHLFIGLKDDVLPNPRQLEGILAKFMALKSLSGYLGAWPSPGLLESLPLGLGQGREVSPGMFRLLIGLYRYTGGGISLLSFSPEIIESSLSQLEPIEGEDEAQLRFLLKNLRGTRIEPWVNAQFSELAASGSRAGELFLDALVAQLGVEAENAFEEAATLLGGRLQCPLGGTYQLIDVQDARQKVWVSDAFRASEALGGSDRPVGGGPPLSDGTVASYRSLLLDWFRGGRGRFVQRSNRLEADVVIDLAARP